MEEPKDATVSNKLTIYAQSNDSEEMGKLTTGDVSRGRAGIGSDYEAEKRGYRAGQITINGGKVTAIARAHDGEPAGIGGGGYSGGAGVVINGGVVDARGYSNYGGYKGIGGPVTVNGGVVTANGIEGSVTINDGVVVSTDRTINKDNSASWNGLVIEQDAGELSGELYGTDVTLDHDFTISEGTTVTIGKGQTLTVNGATLTNNGTITGYGTLDGNGDLEGSGTIADTIKKQSAQGVGG